MKPDFDSLRSLVGLKECNTTKHRWSCDINTVVEGSLKVLIVILILTALIKYIKSTQNKSLGSRAPKFLGTDQIKGGGSWLTVNKLGIEKIKPVGISIIQERKKSPVQEELGIASIKDKKLSIASVKDKKLSIASVKDEHKPAGGKSLLKASKIDFQSKPKLPPPVLNTESASSLPPVPKSDLKAGSALNNAFINKPVRDAGPPRVAKSDMRALSAQLLPEVESKPKGQSLDLFR
jgi:hypothetical protein